MVRFEARRLATLAACFPVLAVLLVAPRASAQRTSAASTPATPAAPAAAPPAPVPAGAGPPAPGASRPTSKTTGYSPYEKETIRDVLKAENLTLDPQPEGKVIEKIDVIRLDVLEKRDPIPEYVPWPSISPGVFSSISAQRAQIPARKFLNSLHYTTREYIVRREMLLREGDRWDQVIIDETARNMRDRMPLQASVVLLLPVRGSSPDKVRLVAITKDIWSLRLSFDFAVTPGGVENFLLVPQETNLLGFHHTAQTRFQYQPETYLFGASYKVPRFGYSWVGATAGANVIINRRSLDPEGSSASFEFGQPLYSTRTEWAWGAEAGYSVGIARRYSNAAVFLFDSARTRDVRDNIPFQYRTRSASASASVTRSFGWAVKNNFSLAMNLSTADYETFDLTGFDPVAVNDFVSRALPRGETRVYPSLTWRTFTTNFLRTIDIKTLALQEDYRLGHDVSVSVYPVTSALGSTRDFFGVSGSAGYALALGDGLVGASVGGVAENVFGSVTDGSVRASFGAVTPRIGIGRIVMNASVLNRYRNYLNARTFTGGDDRLRGYPSNFFFGKDTVFYNLEFRSTAVEILKAQLGGALFFDAGDAASSFDALNAKQSVGFGVRALLPQLNRLVFRADLAFPIKRGPFPETGSAQVVDPVGFYFAFDQAFSP